MTPQLSNKKRVSFGPVHDGCGQVQKFVVEQLAGGVGDQFDDGGDIQARNRQAIDVFQPSRLSQ